MIYALNLADDGRILSVTLDRFAPADQVRVESLPEGDVSEYRYVGGEYIHDPLPKPDEPDPQPTQEERIAALEVENAQLKEALDLLLSGATEEGEADV